MNGNGAEGTVDVPGGVGVINSDSVGVGVVCIGVLELLLVVVVVSASVGVEITPVQTAPVGQHAMLFAASLEQTVSGSQQAPCAPNCWQDVYPFGQVACRFARCP